MESLEGMRPLAVVFLASLAMAFSGCASIVTGQDQTVSVSSPLCPGAQCKLVNDAGVFYIPSTPGTVTVNREYGDLIVTCSRPGHADFSTSVSSTTKSMAFGNIIAGGIIGAAVDIGTGAAYEYPSEVVIPMDCRTEAQAHAAGDQSGQFAGKAASSILKPGACAPPALLFSDGGIEYYRATCKDGTTTTVKCDADKCTALSVTRDGD